MKDLKKETEEILKLRKQLEESRGLQDHPQKEAVWNMAWGRTWHKIRIVGYGALIREYDEIARLL
jgi:hypothetical protein